MSRKGRVSVPKVSSTINMIHIIGSCYVEWAKCGEAEKSAFNWLAAVHRAPIGTLSGTSSGTSSGTYFLAVGQGGLLMSCLTYDLVNC